MLHVYCARNTKIHADACNMGVKILCCTCLPFKTKIHADIPCTKANYLNKYVCFDPVCPKI